MGKVEIAGEFDASHLGSFEEILANLPPLHYEARLVNGYYRNVPANMEFSGSLEKGVVNLAAPKIEYAPQQLQNLTAKVFLLEKKASLSFLYKTVLGDDRFEASAAMDLTYSGP